MGGGPSGERSARSKCSGSGEPRQTLSSNRSEFNGRQASKSSRISLGRTKDKLGVCDALVSEGRVGLAGVESAESEAELDRTRSLMVFDGEGSSASSESPIRATLGGELLDRRLRFKGQWDPVPCAPSEGTVVKRFSGGGLVSFRDIKVRVEAVNLGGDVTGWWALWEMSP